MITLKFTPIRLLLMGASIGLMCVALLTVAYAQNDVAVGENQPMHDMHMYEAVSSDRMASFAPAAANAVNIQSFAFVPNVITVTVGDSVVWTNKDPSQHSIRLNNGSFTSSNLALNDIATRVFTSTGTFDYVCGIHPSMTAKVVVIGADALPTPVATATAQATATPVPNASVAPCLISTVLFTKETASVVTTATGKGVFVLNTVDNTLAYNLQFAGLSASETVAHLHGFAAPGSSAPAVVTIPAGSPKIGVWQYTESQETNILAGLLYANVHSTSFPNGEIRAQITNFVPCKQVNLPLITKFQVAK